MNEELENLNPEISAPEVSNPETEVDPLDTFLDGGVEAPETSEPATPAEAQAPVETPVEEKKYQVEIGGELKEFTLSEIKSDETLLKAMVDGNLRRADYTKKTQELAEGRKQLSADQEQIKQRVAQIESYLPSREVAIQQEYNELANTDLMKLAEEDPVAAQKIDLRLRGLQNEWNQLQGVKAEVSKYREMERNDRIQAERGPAMEFIQANVPAYASGDKAAQAELVKEIVTYGKAKYGLTDADFQGMEGIVGARQFVALYEGMMYQKLAKSASDVVSKRSVRKEAPTVERPSSKGEPQDERADLLKSAREARNSGSIKSIRKTADQLLDSIL